MNEIYNLKKTELYLISQFVPRSKQSVSVIKVVGLNVVVVVTVIILIIVIIITYLLQLDFHPVAVVLHSYRQNNRITAKQ